MLLPFVGCAARGGNDAPREPVTLTVLTYNIHHAEGTDKKLDLERIANVIRATEADLVALQEVDQGTKRTGGVDQPAELARMLDMHVFYGPAMDFQGGKYGNAILSRHPIEDGATIALPYRAGGQREPRSAAAVTCRLSDDRRIVFVSTHFDHTAEPSDRLAQAEAVNRSLSDSGLPSILAGDFNCAPGSPPMLELTSRWTLASSGDPSYGATAERRKSIDHVLVRPKEAWRIIESRVIDEPVASDHRPVLVRLKLK